MSLVWVVGLLALPLGQILVLLEMIQMFQMKDICNINAQEKMKIMKI